MSEVDCTYKWLLNAVALQNACRYPPERQNCQKAEASLFSCRSKCTTMLHVHNVVHHQCMVMNMTSIVMQYTLQHMH